MGLEETQFADLLGGDAAGSEVCNAAGFEFDTNVGDVGFGRENGKPYGADFADGRVGEAENNIEVVDHEIKDDVDIERSRGEDAEAMGLEEHGPVESGDGCGDSRVEALEMADGYDAAVGLSQIDDVVGLGQGGCEGFFNEDVEAGEQELFGYRCVMHGGHADGCGVERQVSSEELWKRREGWDVVGRGERCAALGVRFDKSGELNEFGVSEFQFSIDAKVIAPEGAGTNDGNTQS